MKSHMLSLQQLVQEAIGSQEDIDNMMSRLRDAAIDLSEEMRDFYNPRMESNKVQSFLKDAQDVLTSIGQTHTKWSALKRKYNL